MVWHFAPHLRLRRLNLGWRKRVFVGVCAWSFWWALPWVSLLRQVRLVPGRQPSMRSTSWPRLACERMPLEGGCPARVAGPGVCGVADPLVAVVPLADVFWRMPRPSGTVEPATRWVGGGLSGIVRRLLQSCSPVQLNVNRVVRWHIVRRVFPLTFACGGRRSSWGCPDCRRLLQSQPELGVPIRLLPAFAAVYSCVGQDRTAGSPFVRAGFAAGVPLQGCCQSLRVRERHIGANRP